VAKVEMLVAAPAKPDGAAPVAGTMRALEWLKCDALREQITPHRLYFQRLEKRMYAMGFPADDELFALVKTAAKAADTLWIKLHYQAVDIARRSASDVPFGAREQ